MQMHGIVPESTKYWFLIQWGFVFMVWRFVTKYKYIKNRILGFNIPADLIAQYALAFAHVICNISLCIAYVYRNWLGIRQDIVETYMADWGIGLSVSYFIVDSILILVVDYKTQKLYLIHHILAIFMGMMMYCGVIPLRETVYYMFTIEFSNIAISAWDLVKRARKAQLIKLEEPYILHQLQNILTPILMATYVPARTIILTCASCALLYNLNTENLYLKTAIWLSTVLISFMSYKFAVKVYGIGCKNIMQNNPGLLTFTSLTYVFKAYVSLAWFMLVLPESTRAYGIELGCMLLFVDFIHIIISLAYSSSYKPGIFISALDFAAICVKIVMNGEYIYIRAFIDGNIWNVLVLRNIWDFATYANSLILLFSIVIGSRKAYIAFEKRDIRHYLIHYFISAIIPLFFMPFGTAPYIAILSYFAGGFIWAVYPKSNAALRVFAKSNTVGWMHICATIGDLALLLWGQ